MKTEKKELYIIILNDGTDEIYNINSIICTSWKSFQQLFKESFHSIESKKYYLMNSEKELDILLNLSNDTTITDNENLLINLLSNHFISITTLRNYFKKINQLK